MLQRRRAPSRSRQSPSSITCASVSRVLYPPCSGSPPSIWDVPHGTPLSAHPPECSLRHKDGRSTTLSDPPVYMAFQPVGFTKPLLSPAMLVVSYTTFSPLPPPCDGSAVSLSAALSVAPPFPVMPLPVRKHGALRCPDFPPSHCWKSGGAMHRMSRNSGCWRFNVGCWMLNALYFNLQLSTSNF